MNPPPKAGAKSRENRAGRPAPAGTAKPPAKRPRGSRAKWAKRRRQPARQTRPARQRRCANAAATRTGRRRDHPPTRTPPRPPGREPAPDPPPKQRAPRHGHQGRRRKEHARNPPAGRTPRRRRQRPRRTRPRASARSAPAHRTPARPGRPRMPEAPESQPEPQPPPLPQQTPQTSNSRAAGQPGRQAHLDRESGHRQPTRHKDRRTGRAATDPRGPAERRDQARKPGRAARCGERHEQAGRRRRPTRTARQRPPRPHPRTARHRTGHNARTTAGTRDRDETRNGHDTHPAKEPKHETSVPLATEKSNIKGEPEPPRHTGGTPNGATDRSHRRRPARAGPEPPTAKATRRPAERRTPTLSSPCELQIGNIIDATRSASPAVNKFDRSRKVKNRAELDQ